MFRISLAFAAGVCLSATAAAQSRPTATSQTKTVWPDEGPRTWAPRPTVPDITANDLRTRLYQFADDSMMGRRVGEPGNYKGTAYIASEFKRLGLEPAGENGTYFQDLPYGPERFDSTASRLVAAGSPLALKDSVHAVVGEWARPEGRLVERSNRLCWSLGRQHAARSCGVSRESRRVRRHAPNPGPAQSGTAASL